MIDCDQKISLCASPLCGAGGFVSFRFGLFRCPGCGLEVYRAVFRPDAVEELSSS